MNLDDLNLLVSESVRRAEILDDLGAPSAREAWNELSLIEEQLARLQAPESPGGSFSRRGAVHAALKARDFDRAEALIAEFRAETPTGSELMAPLVAMIDEEIAAFRRRFPNADSKHGWAQIRMVSKILSARRGRSLLVA